MSSNGLVFFFFFLLKSKCFFLFDLSLFDRQVLLVLSGMFLLAVLGEIQFSLKKGKSTRCVFLVCKCFSIFIFTY